MRDPIVNSPKKVMLDDIVLKPLMKGLGTQQTGWGAGEGRRTFALPPHGRHVVRPVEDCAFPHIKIMFDTIVM